MGLAKHDTPRNYDAAADQLLTAITEMSAGALHEWRDSTGFTELSEDIEDVRPIIDGARPGVYNAFSKKPRRLPSGSHPELPDLPINLIGLSPTINRRATPSHLSFSPIRSRHRQPL